MSGDTQSLMSTGPGSTTALDPPTDPARVPVQLVERYPYSPKSEERRDNGTQDVREFQCAYADRHDAIKDLLGYPYIVKNGSGNYLQRYLPDYIPWLTTDQGGFEPPRPYMWCTSCPSTVGNGAIPRDGVTFGVWQECQYEHAFITAVYETLSYEVLSDAEMRDAGAVDNNGNPDESYLLRYVTKLPQPSAKYQTLTSGAFVFAHDGVIVPGTPGTVEVKANFSITWHRVPKAAVGLRLLNPHLAASTDGGVTEYVPPIEACIGKLNIAAFAGAKKGTLLLTAAVIKPITSPIGMRLFDIEYLFDWFGVQSAFNAAVHGHSCVLRADAGTSIMGYDEVVKGNNTATPGTPAVGNRPAAVGTPQAGVTSNYVLTPPLPRKNIYDWASFDQLFRVPALARDQT